MFWQLNVIIFSRSFTNWAFQIFRNVTHPSGVLRENCKWLSCSLSQFSARSQGEFHQVQPNWATPSDTKGTMFYPCKPLHPCNFSQYWANRHNVVKNNKPIIFIILFFSALHIKILFLLRVFSLCEIQSQTIGLKVPHWKSAHFMNI